LKQIIIKIGEATKKSKKLNSQNAKMKNNKNKSQSDMAVDSENNKNNEKQNDQIDDRHCDARHGRDRVHVA